MISYTPVNVVPGSLAAETAVLAGKVTRFGGPDGLSTAQCTYTDTAGPVLRVCTVDYALNNGLIVTSGYIHGPGKGAPVTLVVDGGTGAFAGERGYGTLQPTGRQPRHPAPVQLTRPSTDGGGHAHHVPAAVDCPPVAIIGYLGYRFLTRCERGGLIEALTMIAGSEG